MKAWQQEAAGECNYQLKENVEIPKAGAGFVVVKNVAVGSNPIDHKCTSPMYSAKTPFPATFGIDGAGIVSEVGEGVTDFVVGDKVFYITDLGGKGSYAEFTPVRSALTFKLPKEWNFIEAGTSGCVVFTAAIALFDKLDVQPGQTVLINGGSSGVGSVAVQMAKIHGCRVLAICSEKNFEFVKGLGADECIDYTKGQEHVLTRVKELTHGMGADKLFDCIANEFSALFPLIKFGGSAAVILPAPVDQAAAGAAFGTNLSLHYILVLSYCAVPWTLNKIRSLMYDKVLPQMIIPGKLKIPIAKKFKFATEVQEAQVENLKGRTAGKNVIIVDEAAI